MGGTDNWDRESYESQEPKVLQFPFAVCRKVSFESTLHQPALVELKAFTSRQGCYERLTEYFYN